MYYLLAYFSVLVGDQDLGETEESSFADLVISWVLTGLRNILTGSICARCSACTSCAIESDAFFQIVAVPPVCLSSVC
jgi:hypothetical protein